MLFCKNAITAGDLEKSEERKENSEEYKKKKPLARLFFLRCTALIDATGGKSIKSRGFLVLRMVLCASLIDAHYICNSISCINMRA